MKDLRSTKHTTKVHIAIITGLGLLLRIAYHLTYRAWWAGDSGGYAGPLWQWSRRHLSDGARTPMYPLFLGVAQKLAGVDARPRLAVQSAYAVVGLQSLLGLLSACLLYLTLRTLRVRASLALMAGAAFALIGAVCQFEMIVLTESLSLFSLVLACYLFAQMMARMQEGAHPGKLAVWTGIAFGHSVLVRAENLVFLVALLCVGGALWLRCEAAPTKPQWLAGLRKVCGIVLIAAAPPILAWMTVNYFAVGEFRITTITGFQLNQAVYNLFDRVDSKDRVLGQTMTKYYLAQNQGGHIVRDYMWSGFNELVAHMPEMPIRKRARAGAPNGDLIDMGDYIGHVSFKLACKYPGTWLRNVADTFARDTFDFRYTQTAPVNKIDAQPDPQSVDGRSVIRHEGLWRFVVWLNTAQAPFLMCCYIVTLACVILGPFVVLRHAPMLNDLSHVTVIALASGSVATILAICALESFHNQYGEPHLGVFVLCSAYSTERLFRIFEVWKSARRDRLTFAIAKKKAAVTAGS